MVDAEPSQNTSKTFFSQCHAQQSLKKMQELCLANKLTDVTLVIADIEITAHRLVLSSASDYFYAMFTNDLMESTLSRVPLKGIDPDYLQALVQFCYTGEIHLAEENVIMTLATANILQISEVVKACCDFLASRLDPSNCIGFAFFSKNQGCMDLYHTALAYTMDHFKEVIHLESNKEYLLLSADELKQFLASDMLNVPSEEEAFQSLMMWVDYDLPNRRKDLPNLLETIKLPLLSSQFLVDNMESNQLFREDSTCYNLFVEAMKYHLLPERRSLLQSPRTRPRKSTVGSLFMIGGMDGGKGSCKIEKYDLRSNTWCDYGIMTARRLQFGAAMIDNKLYVVGGREGLKTLNVVECYDFVLKRWISMPSMSTHRHGLGVCVLGDMMYAVGGHDGWTYLNAVEKWDPSTHQWSYVAPLNAQRSTTGVAVLNDRLYAVGGRDGSSCLRSVECFDPFRNKWTFRAPMSIRRGNAGVGVINEYLFALGGHDAPSSNPGVSRFESVERYDPFTDAWTLVAPMKIGRDAIGVGVLGDRLIAVGGYDGQSYLKIVEAYDPQTNEWEE